MSVRCYCDFCVEYCLMQHVIRDGDIDTMRGLILRFFEEKSTAENELNWYGNYIVNSLGG